MRSTFTTTTTTTGPTGKVYGSHKVWELIVEPTMCEWFARCDRPATHTERHPILGDVPICDRCASIGR